MNTKKIIILTAIVLSVVLIFGFLMNCFRKPAIKVPEKINVPENASSDFNGTMLSSYDNIRFEFYEDGYQFDFKDVDLLNYEYVVLDVCDANFSSYDTYTVEFFPYIEGLNLKTISRLDPTDFSESVGGLFDKDSGTFTYIFDLTSIKEGIAKLHLYYNGIFYKTVSVDNFTSTILSSFDVEYGDLHENYGTNYVGNIYLYGFNEGDADYLKYHLANHNFNLSTCKDSLLYNK